MEGQSSADVAFTYWYDEPGVIERRFCGVFEGGGAKGVAYAGALQAMRESKCWFQSVAGASAGAITAALIAAGLSPEEIGRETENGLKQVQTSVRNGLRRLSKETGYFPTEGLREWLDGLLRGQIARKVGTTPRPGITFADLFDATGIELNVVAADLSLRRQVVFSHVSTPRCSVADAVAASSAIPFAFPSQVLEVPDSPNGTVRHHTIVDGGVWSNFPMYIFEDAAFRKHYSRVPEQLEPGKVLGFLLQEGNGQSPPRGAGVKFASAIPRDKFRAKEWDHEQQTATGDGPGWAATVAAWLLYPFSLLGRFVEWNSGVERGRWPKPQTRLARRFLHSINGMLGGIHPPLFGVLACVIVGVGGWRVGGAIVRDIVAGLLVTDWSQLMSYPLRAFTLTLGGLVVAIAVLVVFVFALGVIANHFLLRTGRRILYGLVTTYLAGPGASDWVAERENVVALPIPPDVTTLSFNMPDSQRQALIEAARRATEEKLGGFLANHGLRSSGHATVSEEKIEKART